MIQRRPSSQKAVALSAARAELSAATGSLREAKGLTSLGKDFGEDLRMRVYVDAQASVGLGHCAGLGKKAGTETGELWIQGALEHHAFELANMR